MLFKLLRYGIYSAAILLLGITLFYQAVRWEWFGDLPGETEIRNIHHLESTRVLDRNGEQIGRFYLRDRTPVSLDQINSSAINALIATEDRRFYSHNGVDLMSLLRVGIKSILLGKESSGGGSTITQQLAKNLYPRQRFGVLYYPVNKVREMIIAQRIEVIYSKQEILELYLNTVAFGHDLFGIETASRRFFDKSAAELELQESATLIGLLKANTTYSPVLHPRRSRERRNLVLQLMGDQKYLDETQLDSLKAIPLEVSYDPAEDHSLTSYFLEAVRREAEALLRQQGSESNLLTDGLVIKTTLDIKLQSAAEQALSEHMKELQRLFDDHWEGMLWNDRRDVLALEMEKAGVAKDAPSRPIPVFTWDGVKETELTPMDSVKHFLRFLQAGFVALDPGSGAIRAWVGGIDHRFFPYDHVGVQARRQVGSTFKPFVYAAALEQGISPCKYYKARQVAYEDEEGEWKPGNTNDEYDGKYSMEGALEGSVNTVSVKVLQDAGIDNTIQLVRDAGISSEIPEVPSIALGTPSISLIEMVNAYGVFANQGFYKPYYLIDEIRDRNKHLIHAYQAPPVQRAISEHTARIMVHLLQNAVNEGTGRSLRTVYGLRNDIGGKTGTTQSNADGWFIGISPDLVAGAWVGGTYPGISFRDTRLGQGATMALPIYARFYQQVNADPQLASYSNAQFPALPASMKREVDCDPFRENFNFFDWLFGKKDDKEKNSTEEKESEPRQNIFKKIGSLFKKKK